MYCTKCGTQLNETANFCSSCGAPTRNAPIRETYPKLSRPREDRKIAGVCAGFARYLGIDVTIVRLIAVVSIFCPVGVGLIGYLVAWIIMPNDLLRIPAADSHPEPA